MALAFYRLVEKKFPYSEESYALLTGLKKMDIRSPHDKSRFRAARL
jgi:hypothetical protein